VSIVTKLQIGGSRCDSLHASRLALQLTQPPIQWLPDNFSPGVKHPGKKLSTHLHSVKRLRIYWIISQHSPTSIWHGTYLSTGKNVTFTSFIVEFTGVVVYISLVRQTSGRIAWKGETRPSQHLYTEAFKSVIPMFKYSSLGIGAVREVSLESDPSIFLENNKTL
jgi:hypothetical protein